MIFAVAICSLITVILAAILVRIPHTESELPNKPKSSGEPQKLYDVFADADVIGSGLTDDLADSTQDANGNSLTLEELEYLCPDVFLSPSRECLSALDDYFLDSIHEPELAVRVFLPEEEQMTYRRAFADITNRYEIVKNTLSNEECRITSGPFQWGLKERCNADLIAEVLFLWNVCSRDREAYKNLDPLKLASLFEEAMREVDSAQFQNNEVYIQTKADLKTKFYRTAWLDVKCGEISESVYAPMGVFVFDFDARLTKKKDARTKLLEQRASGLPPIVSFEESNPLDLSERKVDLYDVDDPKAREEALLHNLSDEVLAKQVLLEEAWYENARLRDIALRLGSEWAIATTIIHGKYELIASRDELRPWLSRFERLRGSLLRQSTPEKLMNALTALHDLESYGIEFDRRPIWELICSQISGESKAQCAEYLQEIDLSNLNSDEYSQFATRTSNELNELLRIE